MLAALAACAFLVLAFGAYLDVPELLIRPAGIIHGVANVDAAVRIPALRTLTAAALVGAGAGILPDDHGPPLADRHRGAALSGRVGLGFDRRRSDAAVRDRAQRAGARDAVHRAQHRSHAARVRARPGRRARGERRFGADAAPTSTPTARRSATSGSGIINHCCRRSRRFRRSAPTTTSYRSTTTATGSTASTGRSCCRRAS